MATLTPTLTLASTDASSDAISFSATLGLSVEPPSKGISRINVNNVGASNIIIANNPGEIVYLYVKHTGTTDGSTATTTVVDVEDTNNEAFARLGANEFIFLPYRNPTRNTGVQLQAGSGIVQMEYAFFTKT
jgi:hypothetical protein|tara:strand:+ start:418 stop:813 length:396 start_codon:yes stop_codon:yes gene_type:complete